MKIIGWIILLPFMCIMAPFLFIGACVSKVLENWLGV